jgi:7-cyano-7-deazaguanine synthase in queuosine biosynthesis
VTAETARFRIRTAPFAGHAADPAEWLLDWAPGSRAETIEFTPGFFAGWQPDTAGAELLRFAAGVYCADRVVLRRATPDAWTRDLRVALRVADSCAWRQAPWPAALDFLTGDRWTLQPDTATVAQPAEGKGLRVDAVSLFSGGLDSLCGVIDLLEDNPGMRLLLIAHHEGGKASTAQQALHAGLADAYGAERVVLRRMFCRPAPARTAQERPLPDNRERTTRSRSLLFLAGALAAAGSCGPAIPVYMPENGWISLNVPLTRARTGSASTRTTHPHFLSLFTAACRAIGVTNPVINPYRLRTKGEMLADCSNPVLLARLAPASISCAHPETPRWRRQPQGNCGYCLPCLVRRAALARIGHDHSHDYAWDALTDPGLLDPAVRTGADLRATVRGVSPHRNELDIVRNAPLPPGEHHAYLQLWRRGAEEIRAWLAGGAGSLAQLTATAWSNP